MNLCPKPHHYWMKITVKVIGVIWLCCCSCCSSPKVKSIFLVTSINFISCSHGNKVDSQSRCSSWFICSMSSIRFVRNVRIARWWFATLFKLNFKGILVIASGGDRSEIDSLDTRTPQALTITDPDLTKESIGCENFAVSSITHTEPSEKSVIGMSFKWQIEGQRLFLDENIVKNNNSTAGSQYYFTQYPMQASDINLPKKCGLFGLQTFCPCLQCGLLGRILRLCDPNQC